MKANLSYLKGHLAKWLLNATLIFSLLALSTPVLLSTGQIQITSTELVHVRHKSTIKTAGYYDTFLPLFVPYKGQATRHQHFILFYNCLSKVEFDHITSKFAAIRRSVQKPCITFIFHHSGQETAIV